MTTHSSKNYYAILGIKRSASEAEIKHAYHELVRRYHPDAHPGGEGAEARFKEINEAYSVLADPEKRDEYDALVLERDRSHQRKSRPSTARTRATETATARSRPTGSQRDVVVGLDVGVAGLSVGLGIVSNLIDGLDRALSSAERAASRRPPPGARSHRERKRR
jgi:curved DNA-binding protein CbpA